MADMNKTISFCNLRLVSNQIPYFWDFDRVDPASKYG